MKLITFCVPCYNSEAYMSHCIDTLLTGGEDVEIIIVDDGSKDNTAKIADEYQEKYPTIIKTVHKPNGGHGSGVNKGVELATGLYFKVVDSDDWADLNGYKILLDNIKARIKENNLPDCYVMDFLYNKPSINQTYRRSYKGQFLHNDFTTWDKVKKFSTSEVFLMHALFYKTDKLRASNTILPKHTFYVDDIFAYSPLPYMKTIYYIPEVFYMYFIGRDDQSVTVNNIVDRYKQMIVVFKQMFDAYSYNEIMKMEKGLKRYMLHAINTLNLVTLMFTCGKNTKERKEDTKELWNYCKEKDVKLYKFLRHRGYSVLVNHLPFGLKGKIMMAGYKAEVRKHKVG